MKPKDCRVSAKFREAVNEIKKQQNLSVAKIAKKMGINPSNLSAVMRKERRITHKYIMNAYDTYALNPAFIFETSKQMFV